MTATFPKAELQELVYVGVGVRGVATAISEQISGKSRVCLERSDSNGKPEDIWIDACRLCPTADVRPTVGYAAP